MSKSQLDESWVAVFDENFEEDKEELAIDWRKMYESERREYIRALVRDAHVLVALESEK